MFRAFNKGNAKPTNAPQRPSTSTYSSFRDIYDLQNDGKRKLDDSSSSESEKASDEIIFEKEIINTSHKSHKKRKRKREKERERKEKKEKKELKAKKRRRNSSNSDIEVIPTLNDGFIEDRSRTLNNYNYKFERAIKKKPLRLETNFPITAGRDSSVLKSLFYGDNERVDNWRYYDNKTREKLQTNPTELVFRPLNGPLFVDGMMEISKGPYDPLEEGDNRDYGNNYYDFSEDLTEKIRKFERFGTMSMKKKIDQIRTDIKFDKGASVENWLEFLKLEEEDFNCISRADKSSVNRSGYLDRRLEIIKEGLRKVSKDGLLKLHLEYLKTLTEITGNADEAVIAYWKKIQNTHLNSLELWETYIQQLLHNSSSFKLSNVLKQFDMAISKLIGVATRTIKSHDLLHGTVEFISDLVINRSRLLMEAGNVHVVVAIVQAVAEFQFFMPTKIKTAKWDERLNEFDKFMTTGVPRIGEKNSKGWKNSDLRREGQEAIIQEDLKYEAELAEKADELERSLIDSLSKFDDIRRLVAWSELEKTRSKHFWKPLRPLTELFNDDVCEWSRRLVKSESLKTSLLPFSDKKLALKLLLRLLKILGAVIPGCEDNSQADMLHSILPDDFNFLRQNYTDLAEFLIEFMFQLCGSADIVELEQVLVSIVATKIHFMELENEDSSQKMIGLKQLEERIMRMKIDLVAKHCALLQIYEGYAKYLDLPKNFTGIDVPNFFDNIDQQKKSSEQRLFENVILMLKAGDPFKADGRQKQILLKAAMFVSTHLPSHRSGATMNRLRFLSFFVLEKVHEFAQEDINLSAEAIESARTIWFKHLQTVLEREEQSDFYSFMEKPSDLILMLYSLLELEYKEVCPFTNLLQFTNSFIERSETRTLFRLDFSHELWKTRICQWTNYSEWTLNAVAKNPNSIGLYRHLANVFGAKSCHFRHFVDWKLSDPKLKRQQTMAMFAAEYQLFKKASEMDDSILVEQSYKRIRQIMEEAAALISDSFTPDSFIWRLWHFIEREGRIKDEIEKVYLLGVRSCPFSKQFLVDATLSPFTPQNRLEEIKELSDKFELCIFTIPEEADTIMEVALKSR